MLAAELDRRGGPRELKAIGMSLVAAPTSAGMLGGIVAPTKPFALLHHDLTI